jgi:UDPglucose 6-dehydrogenase
MHLRGDTVIATKSTVPLGTGEEIEAIIRSEHPDGEWSVVSNPEFLREGAAIEDFMHPDRVVIGVEDARARSVMERLYQPLQERGAPLVFTTRRTAELIKYAANAFLAAKIAFIGEMADLCEKSGANVEDVALGIGLDRRIGSRFLQAGPGYGGSCFPKDALALVSTARRFGNSPRIVEAVIAANEARKRSMVDKIMDGCGGSVRGKRIAVLGLAFKAGTDDMREAPSLVILPALEALGARVCACDPAAGAHARKLLPRIRIVSDPYECTRESDAVVILTEWDEFKRLDLDRIKSGLRKPLIIDLRNIYRPDEMLQRGFSYSSIGRPTVGNGQDMAPARGPVSSHPAGNSRSRRRREDSVDTRPDASRSAPDAWTGPLQEVVADAASREMDPASPRIRARAHTSGKARD